MERLEHELSLVILVVLGCGSSRVTEGDDHTTEDDGTHGEAGEGDETTDTDAPREDIPSWGDDGSDPPCVVQPIEHWEEVGEFTDDLSGHASVFVGEFLYVIGGSRGESSQGTTEVSFVRLEEDPGLDHWVETAALPSGLDHPRVSVRGHQLVLVGGAAYAAQNRVVLVTSVQQDGHLSPWQGAVEGLPEGRVMLGSALVGDRLYVTGGMPVWLDPSLGSVLVGTLSDAGVPENWKFGTSLPQARSWHDTVATTDHLYVIAGWQHETAQSDVYVAPFSGTGIGEWVPTTGLPNTLKAHRAFIGGDQLWVIGGSNSEVQSAVWRTSIQPDGQLAAWEPDAPLPEPRFLHDTVVAGPHVYVIGGNYDFVSHDGPLHTATPTVFRARFCEP